MNLLNTRILIYDNIFLVLKLTIKPQSLFSTSFNCNSSSEAYYIQINEAYLKAKTILHNTHNI